MLQSAFPEGCPVVSESIKIIQQAGARVFYLQSSFLLPAVFFKSNDIDVSVQLQFSRGETSEESPHEKYIHIFSDPDKIFPRIPETS